VLSRRHGQSKKPPTIRYGLGFCWAIISAWRRSIVRRGTIQAGMRPAQAHRSAPHGGHARDESARLVPDRRTRLQKRFRREHDERGGVGVGDPEALQLVADRAKQDPDSE
jgi:hypothetical protein